eukprot:3831260-Rhodomonas_salina.1
MFRGFVSDAHSQVLVHAPAAIAGPTVARAVVAKKGDALVGGQREEGARIGGQGGKVGEGEEVPAKRQRVGAEGQREERREGERGRGQEERAESATGGRERGRDGIRPFSNRGSPQAGAGSREGAGPEEGLRESEEGWEDVRRRGGGAREDARRADEGAD